MLTWSTCATKTSGCAKQLARVNSDQARMVELEAENQHLWRTARTEGSARTDAVAANVIGSDATGLSRTLILTSGSDDGLEPGWQ